MNYPLKLSFKLLALASQIYIRDAQGNLVGYVKQKLLKLKEDINVFADENQTRHLFNIKGDRMMDFSARYNFTDDQGRSLGSIKRKGMRSIFKANYEVYDAAGTQVMHIHEENGWIKVAAGKSRDRFGIAPLYWTRQGDWLLFASEIKAILASGLLSPRIDRTSIDEGVRWNT